MRERPTDDQLVDFSETGYHGCLLPDIEDAPEGGGEGEGDDE